MFELRGSAASFVAAVQRIEGLELVDEETLATEDEAALTAYLLVPDATALSQVQSLWHRWQRGEALDHGFAGWRDAFALLHDLRPWGPADRVEAHDQHYLERQIEGLADEERVRIEAELVFRANGRAAEELERSFLLMLETWNGALISTTRIEEVSYHALLIELPVVEVRRAIARSQESIAGFDGVMHVRPQSVASSIELADPEVRNAEQATGDLGTPILALLDGVPLAQHALLTRHLVVDDQFELEPDALVEERRHGTAMASLIVHGDRNQGSVPLPRRLHVVPVMSARVPGHESFPSDRLVVDVVYEAVRAMREGVDATAPNVLLVNLSLGDTCRPFHGRISPWARLLDRLSYRYGILFVVSAGNVAEPFDVSAFRTRIEFEDADSAPRSVGVLSAVNVYVGQRRIIAPAESINALTVGSCNLDAVAEVDRRAATSSVDPYGELKISNPSSALGPGYAGSVKPDVLMPGSKERLLVVRSGGGSIAVSPAPPGRAAGLRVASPPRVGQENSESFTCGTSAAAALASRTCHRIHDALEAAYGDDFIGLSSRQRAVLLKTLFAHAASWPEETVEMMKGVLGPSDARQHVKQKDNIRRYLGYGLVDADSSVACVDDRATFWAVGEVASDSMVHIPVPIPVAIAGLAQPHSVSATIGWITPTRPGTRAYKSIRLTLLEPEEMGGLGLSPSSLQPDKNQGSRGTLFSRRWEGSKAPSVQEDMVLRLHVQREPDQSQVNDEPVPFGLAVTISMPGVVGIYQEVRQRLEAQPRVAAGRQ